MNKGAVLADQGDLTMAVGYFERAGAAGHPLGVQILELCKLYKDMDPCVGPEIWELVEIRLIVASFLAIFASSRSKSV
jgi:hypothetical protein